jgi:Protein of unknown function (DUF2934)
METKSQKKGVRTSRTSSESDQFISREKIALRAYELWCKRGRPADTDRQDWIAAEAELRAELARSAPHVSPRASAH